MALRSAPAQNAPPAPVSTQARMPGSRSTSSQASRIRASIGPLSALRAGPVHRDDQDVAAALSEQVRLLAGSFGRGHGRLP